MLPTICRGCSIHPQAIVAIVNSKRLLQFWDMARMGKKRFCVEKSLGKW
jgi:hypothetical protein